MIILLIPCPSHCNLLFLNFERAICLYILFPLFYDKCLCNINRLYRHLWLIQTCFVLMRTREWCAHTHYGILLSSTTRCCLRGFTSSCLLCIVLRGRLFYHHQRGVFHDAFPLLDADSRHLAVLLGLDVVGHLHGFQHNNCVAGLHLVAYMN